MITEWDEDTISDNEGIVLKPIYISLNGVSKIESVNKLIKEALNPFLYSKGVEAVKNIFKGVVKASVKVDLDSLTDNEDKYSLSFDINPFSLLSTNNTEIKGKKVLIFDDIERCKIDIDELFGYINNFVEHLTCKVILIGDEEKIKSLYEAESDIKSKIQYKDFKEKLIGQTFLIKKDLNNDFPYQAHL